MTPGVTALVFRLRPYLVVLLAMIVLSACDLRPPEGARLTRYFGSALEPDELCLVVEDEFPGLDEVNVSPLGRRVCSYWIRDLPGGYGAFLNIREPIFEIPPENENELIESVPIDVPHESVLYLTTRR